MTLTPKNRAALGMLLQALAAGCGSAGTSATTLDVDAYRVTCDKNGVALSAWARSFRDHGAPPELAASGSWHVVSSVQRMSDSAVAADSTAGYSVRYFQGEDLICLRHDSDMQTECIRIATGSILGLCTEPEE